MAILAGEAQCYPAGRDATGPADTDTDCMRCQSLSKHRSIRCAAVLETAKVAAAPADDPFASFKTALVDAVKESPQPSADAQSQPASPSATQVTPAESVQAPTLPAPAEAAPVAPTPPTDTPVSSFEPSAFDLPDIYPMGKSPVLPNKTAPEVPSLSDVFGGLNKAVEGALSGVKSSVSGLTEGLPQPASPLPGQTEAAADRAGAAVTGAVDDITGVITGGVDSLSKSLGGSVNSLTDDVGKSLSGAGSAVTDAVSTVTSSVSSSIKVVTEGAVGAVDGAVEGVTGALEGTVGPLVQAVQGAGVQVYNALPEPLQQAASAAGPQLSRAADFAADNPTVAAAAAAAGLATPVAGYYYLRYSGYAGDLTPQQTLQLLRNEQAVLIDVRPDEQRASAGVPELRRTARGKAAAVPLYRFDTITTRRLKGAADVELLATAALVAGLSQVNVATKVVFMDSKGELAVRLAKALRREGVSRAYAMSGGFAAWLAEGLPVEENNAYYDVSAIGALAEDAEALIEKTQETLVNTPPTTYATIGVSTAVVAWALYNYHTTLQFIGVAGSLGLLVNWYSQFDSPEDALQDLNDKYTKLTGAVKKVTPKRSSSSSAGSGVSSNASSSVDA